MIWDAIGVFIAGIVMMLFLLSMQYGVFAVDCPPSMGPDPIVPCYPTFAENPFAHVVPPGGALVILLGLVYGWDLIFRRWTARNATLGREFWLQGTSPDQLNVVSSATDQRREPRT